MLRKLQERVVVLQDEVKKSLAQQHPGGEVKRDFTSFPSKEFMNVSLKRKIVYYVLFSFFINFIDSKAEVL